jgi:NADH-quinone oxidoreductase subunit J
MDFLNKLPEILNDFQASINFYSITFYVFVTIIIGAGLMTILSKKLMHSAIGLLFTFLGVAGIYALLSADFVAITQIMVYIGGILTLIIFGVMLTSRIIDVDLKMTSRGKFAVVIGTVTSIVVGIFFSILFVTSDWKQEALIEPPKETINSIGNLLMTDYLATFIATAILLLVAFIGAALIARRKN